MAELRSEAPELIPSLHRRAASWFADHGDEARGLVHAVEAEAWDLAARLAARMHLARLDGDLDSAVERGRSLLGEGQVETRSVDPGLRALALVQLGIAELWAGDAEEAEHHLERGRGAAAEAGQDWLVLMAVAHLALLGATTSDYARSARLAGDAIALAEAQGWDRTWPAGAAYLALASAEFLWDRSDDAVQTLEQCRAALGGTQEPPLRAGLALLRSVALDRQGAPESALAVLEAGVEELGDWPLLPSWRNQFAAREAVIRPALGSASRPPAW